MNGLTPGVLVAVGGMVLPMVATAESDVSPLPPDFAAAAAFSSLKSIKENRHIQDLSIPDIFELFLFKDHIFYSILIIEITMYA